MYKFITAALYAIAVVSGVNVSCDHQCEPCDSPCEAMLRESGPLPYAFVKQACRSWPPSASFCKAVVLGASFYDVPVNLAKVLGCSSVKVSHDSRFYLIHGLQK
jgi:hypothetical protein